MAKRKKSYIYVCMAVVFLLLFGAIFALSGAYFTASDSDNSQVEMPSVSLQIYHGDTLVTNGEISLSSAQDISIKSTSNIPIYVRAKVILSCVDSTTGNHLSNLNPSDYVIISLSNFASVAGYDDNFVYFYNTSTSIFNHLQQNGTVVLLSASNILAVSEPPQNVSLKLSVFVEGVQKDDSNFGLSRWEA